MGFLTDDGSERQQQPKALATEQDLLEARTKCYRTWNSLGLLLIFTLVIPWVLAGFVFVSSMAGSASSSSQFDAITAELAASQ